VTGYWSLSAREGDRVAPAMDAELLQQAVDVVFDGRDAEAEARGDLLIAPAAAQHQKDLTFAGSEADPSR
jgi:hypothetical protein